MFKIDYISMCELFETLIGQAIRSVSAPSAIGYEQVWSYSMSFGAHFSIFFPLRFNEVQLGQSL